MESHDQFDNEVYQRNQDEFLAHMFLMEQSLPKEGDGSKPTDPNSNVCTCCNGFPDSCSDPTCIGIGMCICTVTEDDIEEIGDLADFDGYYGEAAEPQRKKLVINNDFAPFVPAGSSTPSQSPVTTPHQYTLTPEEVEKYERELHISGSDETAINTCMRALWKLRLHKYGSDPDKTDVLWNPNLEPKLPLLPSPFVNIASLYSKGDAVKNQYLSLEWERRWHRSKSQDATEAAQKHRKAEGQLEEKIVALAKKENFSF